LARTDLSSRPIVLAAPTDYLSFAYGGTLSFIQEFLSGLSPIHSERVALLGLVPAADFPERGIRTVGGRAFHFVSVGRARGDKVPLRLRFAAGILTSRKRVQTLKPGMFYAHSAESALALRIVCRGIPIVLHCHGTTNTIKRSRFWYGRLAPSQWLYENLLLRPAMRAASKIVVTAGVEDYERFVDRHRRALGDRSIRVGAMVDLDLFRPARGKPSRNGPLCLIAVGRVERLKGYDLVISAVHRLVSNGVSVRLTIVGEGNDQPRLQEQVDLLGLRGTVTFKGYMRREELAHEMRKADLYVSGSEQEGFSLALLEALSSGLPAVVTNVGGVAEVIREDQTGYVCGSRSQVEMAGLIRRASERMDAMREECRRVASLYSSELVSARIYGEFDHA